jgi:hypothetical protein
MGPSMRYVNLCRNEASSERWCKPTDVSGDNDSTPKGGFHDCHRMNTADEMDLYGWRVDAASLRWMPKCLVSMLFSLSIRFITDNLSPVADLCSVVDNSRRHDKLSDHFPFYEDSIKWSLLLLIEILGLLAHSYEVIHSFIQDTLSFISSVGPSVRK